jgi:uncharacterized protein
MTRRGAGLVVLAALLCGCTIAVAGRPTAPPPDTTRGPVPESTAVAEPCGSAGTPSAIVSCLVTDVSRFWSARLPEPVDEPMIVDPPRSSVPADCRALLSLGTAFYCTDDQTVYLTGASIERGTKVYGPDLPYALAAVVGHEFGHVVQDAVHQPGFNTPGDAASRRIEQQADCLLGVWGRSAADRGLLAAERLRDIAEREYATVESLPVPPVLGDYDERATHGTVAERVAALDRGLAKGHPDACGLVKP